MRQSLIDDLGLSQEAREALLEKVSAHNGCGLDDFDPCGDGPYPDFVPAYRHVGHEGELPEQDSLL